MYSLQRGGSERFQSSAFGLSTSQAAPTEIGRRVSGIQHRENLGFKKIAGIKIISMTCAMHASKSVNKSD